MGASCDTPTLMGLVQGYRVHDAYAETPDLVRGQECAEVGDVLWITHPAKGVSFPEPGGGGRRAAVAVAAAAVAEVVVAVVVAVVTVMATVCALRIGWVVYGVCTGDENGWRRVGGLPGDAAAPPRCTQRCAPQP